MAVSDPYEVLGIPHSAGEAEIRAAYRRMVKLHHPDHNGGSPESARRFEQIQEAYALIWQLRDNGRRSTTSTPKPPPSDPGLEARLADLQRDIEHQAKAKAEAMRAHEQAVREARDAAGADGGRPSDEELGYITTDDSISAILDDAASEWSKRLSERDDEALSERLADILDEVSAGLREHPPDDD